MANTMSECPTPRTCNFPYDCDGFVCARCGERWCWNHGAADDFPEWCDTCVKHFSHTGMAAVGDCTCLVEESGERDLGTCPLRGDVENAEDALSIWNGPNQGDWSVFAGEVVAERDKLREELAEAIYSHQRTNATLAALEDKEDKVNALLSELTELYQEWLDTPFFSTEAECRKWRGVHAKRIEGILAKADE